MRATQKPSAKRWRRALWAFPLAAALLASGCGVGDDSRRLLLGHGAAPGNPRAEAAERFSQIVGEKSSERLRVQVFGSEQLGSDSEMMVSIASGTLDMTVNSQGPLATSVPELTLVGLPFLFDTPEHAYEVLDGPVGDEFAEMAEEKGYKVLAWWDNGIRHVTNSRRAVEDSSDLAGLKIRTPDDGMTIDIFGTLGANPTPMAFGELYLGLRQGAVDGQENPLVNIEASNLHEVQTHLTLSGHKYEVTPFVVSTQTWTSLSEEDQRLLQDAAIEARDHQRQLMAEQTDRILAEFQDSMRVTEIDRDEFRAATDSVYERWEERYPEVFERLVQAVEDTRPSEVSHD
ncbi:TRAP transporter substrate-binding protein [Actinoalloteichus caeruleus]|uniref:TRAP transporter substrate-binding protein n=1 Tax=Actinoalloteichus cyanogriseus TaxID=2893586 RepID=UPI003BB918DD